MATITGMMNSLFPNLALHYKVARRIIGRPLLLRVIEKAVLNRRSHLHSSGWIRSFQEERPVDCDGNPVPWMNYSITKLLETRLNSHLDLFEYGSGYSTLFFSRLVNHVTSVEYDETWLDILKQHIPHNVTLLSMAADIDGEYCRAIRSAGRRYDVVVIDGRDRVNCMKEGIRSVTDTGVVLLDDSQREYYKEAIEYATQHGFRMLSIEGPKVAAFDIHRTTVFYRDNNCLGIQLTNSGVLFESTKRRRYLRCFRPPIPCHDTGFG